MAWIWSEKVVSVAIFKCSIQWLNPFRKQRPYLFGSICMLSERPNVVCLLLRKFVDCAIFVVCFPVVYNFGFFECFKPLFGINFRFGHWSQNSAYHKSVERLSTRWVSCTPCTDTDTNTHTVTNASNGQSHRCQWIMHFTWAHPKYICMCMKSHRFAFASDEQRRALNLHEISIDLLLNSNKLSVAVFAAGFGMHIQRCERERKMFWQRAEKESR